MERENGKTKEGLEHLVSDISDVLAPPAKPKVQPQAPQTANTLPPETLSNEVGSTGANVQYPGSSWFSRNKGALIVWGVIGAFVAFSMLDDKPSKPSRSSAPRTSETAESSRPNAARTSEIIEERPPVGSGLVLSYPQIRYCLAEEIRINELQRLINGYAELEVTLFNVAINEYNKRCAQFRYRGSALQTVRQQVESRRLELEQQARARLAQWRR